jgi:hypothetical protein
MPEIHIKSPLLIGESQNFGRIGYHFRILSIVTEEDNLLFTMFELELDRLIEGTDNRILINSNHLPILDEEIISHYNIWNIVKS